MNIIELSKITKQYATNIGCFDVDISVKQGDVYGFIGPNGAGKTTLIRQMIGFIKSNQGEGKIFGFDIWKESDKIMKSLGYVAGEITLPEYMTGIEYLKTIAKIRGNVDWKYVEKLIDYFNLNVKMKIKKMSKGMKQKVALINAFMHKPKLLIFDEPTSGLDPLMQEKFNTLIRNCKQEGTTIFMSSHIFGEIENVCDKVAVIKKGRIISEIDMHDMKNNIDKNYEIKFTSMQEYDAFIAKKWNILKKDEFTKNIKVSIPKDNVNKFLKDLAEYKIDQFKELPFNLEDHFIKFYQDEVQFND